ncbi:MAG: cytidine deaminase [Ferruginibacter sp.]
MIKKDIHFSVEVYHSVEELKQEDAELLTTARKITAHAYAPYSNFLVGAVAMMSNGEMVTGTNQENASYPVGLCAERVLLSCAASQYPGVPIETIAISYDNTKGTSNHPISPCGICRQTLAEYQDRVNQPIRILMSGKTGEVHIIENVRQLLPLSFGASDMQ